MSVCIFISRELVKMQIVIQQVWSRASKFTFLTSTQVRLILLVHRPYFEQQGAPTGFHCLGCQVLPQDTLMYLVRDMACTSRCFKVSQVTLMSEKLKNLCAKAHGVLYILIFILSVALIWSLLSTFRLLDTSLCQNIHIYGGNQSKHFILLLFSISQN